MSTGTMAPTNTPSSANKNPLDAKREEFRKYLEKEGILEQLTKTLVSLYEEPERPNDGLNYLKNNISGSDALITELNSFKTDNDQLKEKVDLLEKEKFLLNEKLNTTEKKIKMVEEELSKAKQELATSKAAPIVAVPLVATLPPVVVPEDAAMEQVEEPIAEKKDDEPIKESEVAAELPKTDQDESMEMEEEAEKKDEEPKTPTEEPAQIHSSPIKVTAPEKPVEVFPSPQKTAPEEKKKSETEEPPKETVAVESAPPETAAPLPQ